MYSFPANAFARGMHFSMLLMLVSGLKVLAERLVLPTGLHVHPASAHHPEGVVHLPEVSLHPNIWLIVFDVHGRSAAPGMVVAQWQAAGMTNTNLPRCRELIQVLY